MKNLTGGLENGVTEIITKDLRILGTAAGIRSGGRTAGMASETRMAGGRDIGAETTRRVTGLNS